MFKRPGLKTGLKNDSFLSEIGSGFRELGGTPPRRIPRGIPPGFQVALSRNHLFREEKVRKVLQ